MYIINQHLFYISYIHTYVSIYSIKINMATDEGNSRNEIWHWTDDEIGVAVQNWLWVWVELMAWTERLNRIQWSLVQIPLRPPPSNFLEVLQRILTYIHKLMWSRSERKEISRCLHTNWQDFQEKLFHFFLMQIETELKEIHKTFI